MDNTTAEYTFVTSFFTPESPAYPSSLDIGNPLFSPAAPLFSPGGGGFLVQEPRAGFETSIQTPIRADSIIRANNAASTEDLANLNTIWKQIVDPVLEYTQVCCTFSFRCAPHRHRTRLLYVPCLTQSLRSCRSSL